MRILQMNPFPVYGELIIFTW